MPTPEYTMPKWDQPEPTPGPWSSSNERELRPLSCGCVYRRGFRTWRGAPQWRAEVTYCPLHAVAPELAGALRDLLDTLQWLQDSGNLKSPIEPHPYGLGVLAAKQWARGVLAHIGAANSAQDSNAG